MREGIEKLCPHAFQYFIVGLIVPIAVAYFLEIKHRTNIMVDVAEAEIFWTCHQTPRIQLHVLQARQFLVEAPDTFEEDTTHERTGSLPHAVMLQEAQQFFTWGLRIPEPPQVSNGLFEQSSAEDTEIKSQVALHVPYALLQAMGPKQIIGVEEDDQFSAALF